MAFDLELHRTAATGPLEQDRHELRGELMLKADAGTSADFADAGCSQWIYPNRKTGRDVAMPYW
ncbi:MAG: TfoX/Sxy family protein, partial [Pseudomonadota bacterium]|nr:TfoX/Sxy family protein [Pseudomonadota bacterium]